MDWVSRLPAQWPQKKPDNIHIHIQHKRNNQANKEG